MLSAPRVLVIDDERYVRGLLSELLTVWGCEADVAASGSGSRCSGSLCRSNSWRWRFARPWASASRGSSSSLSQNFARIERVAEAVPDVVDGQDGEKDRRPREDGPVRREVEVVLRVVQD